MTIQVPDISSYQKGISLDGIDAVICKATEDGGTVSNRYENPDYARVRDGMKAKGGLFEAYHFIHPDNPAGEADYAISIIGQGVPTMVDAETSGLTLQQIIAFDDAYKANGGFLERVYIPRWFCAANGITDLTPITSRGIHITASSYPGGTVYPGDTASGWNTYDNATPDMWQWTDSYPLNGFKVDMNAFRGTLDELRALWTPGGTAPVVPPVSYPVWPGGTLVWNDLTIVRYRPAAYEWQVKMKDRGWNITADGYYGPVSAATCLAFQKDSTAHGWPLEEDSKLGPLTWKATWLRPVSH